MSSALTPSSVEPSVLSSLSTTTHAPAWITQLESVLDLATTPIARRDGILTSLGGLDFLAVKPSPQAAHGCAPDPSLPLEAITLDLSVDSQQVFSAVLKRATESVDKRATLILSGASGSGKTTILRRICHSLDVPSIPLPSLPPILPDNLTSGIIPPTQQENMQAGFVTILDRATALLGEFGNAATSNNPSSSRFVSVMRIRQLTSGHSTFHLSTTLLETSRASLIIRSPFHIMDHLSRSPDTFLSYLTELCSPFPRLTSQIEILAVLLAVCLSVRNKVTLTQEDVVGLAAELGVEELRLRQIIWDVRGANKDEQRIANWRTFGAELYGKLFDTIVAAINRSFEVGMIPDDSAEVTATVDLIDTFGVESTLPHLGVNAIEEFGFNAFNDLFHREYLNRMVQGVADQHARDGIDFDQHLSLPSLSDDHYLRLQVEQILLDAEDDIKTKRALQQVQYKHKHREFSRVAILPIDVHPSSLTFTYEHYFGQVKYHLSGWGESNRHRASLSDQAQCLASTSRDDVKDFVRQWELSSETEKGSSATTRLAKARRQAIYLMTGFADNLAVIHCLNISAGGSVQYTEASLREDLRIQLERSGALAALRVRHSGFARSEPKSSVLKQIQNVFPEATIDDVERIIAEMVGPTRIRGEGARLVQIGAERVFFTDAGAEAFHAGLRISIDVIARAAAEEEQRRRDEDAELIIAPVQIALVSTAGIEKSLGADGYSDVDLQEADYERGGDRDQPEDLNIRSRNESTEVEVGESIMEAPIAQQTAFCSPRYAGTGPGKRQEAITVLGEARKSGGIDSTTLPYVKPPSGKAISLGAEVLPDKALMEEKKNGLASQQDSSDDILLQDLRDLLSKPDVRFLSASFALPDQSKQTTKTSVPALISQARPILANEKLGGEKAVATVEEFLERAMVEGDIERMLQMSRARSVIQSLIAATWWAGTTEPQSSHGGTAMGL